MDTFFNSNNPGGNWLHNKDIRVCIEELNPNACDNY